MYMYANISISLSRSLSIFLYLLFLLFCFSFENALWLFHIFFGNICFFGFCSLFNCISKLAIVCKFSSWCLSSCWIVSWQLQVPQLQSVISSPLLSVKNIPPYTLLSNGIKYYFDDMTLIIHFFRLLRIKSSVVKFA